MSRSTDEQKHLHRVLVVDDEKSTVDTVKSVLAEEFDVVTARDGREALDLINDMENPQDIHLIISDQKMPRMCGVEFLAATVAIIPKTIRIILTGYTEVDDIISSINDGQIHRTFSNPSLPETCRPLSGTPFIFSNWRRKTFALSMSSPLPIPLCRTH